MITIAITQAASGGIDVVVTLPSGTQVASSFGNWIRARTWVEDQVAFGLEQLRPARGEGAPR